MAGTIVADQLEAASTSTLVIKNGVANTPPTIQDSAGTQIGTFCRAWVNFNGTTVTSPASMTGVRGSFNVSSILDNGTGNYTVNFTTAMPDVNFCVQITGGDASTGAGGRISSIYSESYAVGNVQVTATGATSNTSTVQQLRDFNFINVAVFR